MAKIKRLFLFIGTFLVYLTINAQDCNPPNPPSDRCVDAPVVCDLNGWCGNSGGYTDTSQPDAFCGIVENNCWVSFRAYTTFLEIQITTANCNNGAGVQAQMFYTEDCSSFESVSNCLNPVPANQSRVLVANGLEPGTIYHIMVDGKGEDYCDFSFEVLAGRTSPLADLDEEYAVCEKDTFLLGQDIDFINAYSYFWSTDTGNFVSSPDGPTTLVDTAGLYTITVIDKAHGCVDTSTIEVVIPPPPYLEIANPDTLDCGANLNITLDASNTDFEDGYMVDWLRFDGESVGSQLLAPNISVPGWYYLNLTTALGCEGIDSVEVTSSIEFPIANAGLGDEIDCLNTVVTLDGSNSSAESFFEYQWTSPNGNIVGANDQLIVEADQAGVYTLQVTNSENDCFTTDQVIVTLNDAEPEGVLSEITDPCFGETNGIINIIDVVGGIAPYQYQLADFLTPDIPFFQNLSPGDYPLLITDQTGCTWDTIIQIAEPEPIILELGPNQTIDLGDEITLNTNLNRPMEQVLWSPSPDSTLANAESHTFLPLEDQTYTIQAKDDNNCVEVDEISIQVLEKEKVYIPNAFSPNDDGINDILMIHAGKDVAEIVRFQLYDRWGELLFEQNNFMPNDPQYGWNGLFRGKLMNQQVVTYVVDVLYINGKVKTYADGVTIIY